MQLEQVGSVQARPKAAGEMPPVRRARAACSERSRDGFEAFAGLADIVNDSLFLSGERTSSNSLWRPLTSVKVARLICQYSRVIPRRPVEFITERTPAFDANQG